jgi:hypothetical protein
MQCQVFQRGEDGIGCAGSLARGIEILDPDQPFAAASPRLEITADGGDQRAEMQRAAR